MFVKPVLTAFLLKLGPVAEDGGALVSFLAVFMLLFYELHLNEKYFDE